MSDLTFFTCPQRCDAGGRALEQMFGLIWNAAVRMIAYHTSKQYVRSVPCDLTASCEQALGHTGHCDPEELDF